MIRVTTMNNHVAVFCVSSNLADSFASGLAGEGARGGAQERLQNRPKNSIEGLDVYLPTRLKRSFAALVLFLQELGSSFWCFYLSWIFVNSIGAEWAKPSCGGSVARRGRPLYLKCTLYKHVHQRKRLFELVSGTKPAHRIVSKQRLFGCKTMPKTSQTASR